ncbi:hypothetical protein V8C86DRAFT_2779708 [Haematococcus lacustris]
MDEPDQGVLLYYCYLRQIQEDVHSVAAWYEERCDARGLKGRVRVAEDGVNVTLGGSMAALEHHICDVRRHPVLGQYSPDFKLSASQGALNTRSRAETGFAALAIRRCKELVTLGPLAHGRADPHAHAARHLTPLEFHTMLQQATCAQTGQHTAGPHPSTPAASLPTHQGCVLTTQGCSQPQPGAQPQPQARSQPQPLALPPALPCPRPPALPPAPALSPPSCTSPHPYPWRAPDRPWPGQDGAPALGPAAPKEPGRCQAREVVLLDARNVYETEIGHFDAAGVALLDPGTRCFSDLPAWLEAQRGRLAHRRILMYCTGGVRCERASAYIKEMGPEFQDVFQLAGGPA